MAFTKKTIKDISITGKTVLLRTDYNVPINNGRIVQDYRIKMSVPTIQFLLDKGCKVIICSHLGRPEGKKAMEYTLAPVAKHLKQLLGKDLFFIPEAVGETAQKAVAALKPGQVALLENLRFYSGEEANDKEFAEQLAAYADVFVQDGFGVVHRAHASNDAITKFLPSVAGLLLEKEAITINSAMSEPVRPLMAIVGGAKITDKIQLLERFIKIVDVLVIGGPLANTFLLARGIKVGKSLVDKEDIPLAKRIMELANAEAKKRKFIFYLPQDGVVSTGLDSHTPTRIVDWNAHVIAQILSYPRQPLESMLEVKHSEAIFDVGPYSGAFISGLTQLCGTVVWNGTLGVTEVAGLHGPIGPFAHGTEAVIESLIGEMGHAPVSIVGGGDTAAYIEERKLSDCFTHVSTGGGASLELMAGKKLPGIEALQNK